MVKTTLVGPDLILGTEALRALDSANFPVTVAMWLLQKERSEDWMLILATPLYEKLGPTKAYAKLREAFSQENPILHDLPIRLESNRRPLIKNLRKLFAKGASVEGMRLGLQSIGGVWIDDAYVYQIR